MLQKITAWLRGEAVLVVSAVCALVSMVFVPPSKAYVAYMDWQVLCLLLCLMAVVAGLRACGAFKVLAQRLLVGDKDVRRLQLVLVWLTFFSSMFITNDVALITFIPFTLMILEMAGEEGRILPLVILQTLAANLGSMATPIGNPQNLFLCGAFDLTLADFFATLLPYTLLSFAALSAAALWGRKRRVQVDFREPIMLENPRMVAFLAALFGLCLLSVFHLLPYQLLTVLVVGSLLIVQRRYLAMVDYSLLATFVFFFIFAGNMGEIPALHTALSALMEKSALLTSALASQVISNVPAAVLLAGFTTDWRGLLLGVDLGGLGTPIASLASLIALRFYMTSRHARLGKFLAWFSLANFAGLAVLLALAQWQLL